MRVKLLRDDAVLPTRSNPRDAGWDLYLPKRIMKILIEPGEDVMLPTGMAIELPRSPITHWETVGHIKPRSSQWMHGTVTVGTIDSGYRGEIQVRLRNLSDYGPDIIRGGDRIGQLVIGLAYVGPISEGELSPSERGELGFGSSGR